MSIKHKSFISVKDLETSDLQEIFKRTALFKEADQASQGINSLLNLEKDRLLKAFLVFQEPSTRTRISFEIACHHLGVTPILFSDIKSTSMMKGESLEGTLDTLACFNPNFIVLRHKGSALISKDYPIPIVSAGFGSYEHPTQALIDAFTIQEAQKQVKGKRVLIVGDVLHSRVSNSNLKLLKKMGAEVAFCSPTDLRPQGRVWEDVKQVSHVNEGVKWADVLMCLRIQRERHEMGIGLSIAEYRDNYHIGAKQLELLKKDGVILHPGPHVCGVEIGSEVLSDSRSRILTQVKNGIYIRTALLSLILDLKLKT